MTAYWHPLSAVYLEEPRVLASPTVLRMMLANGGPTVVRYAGDRMWPAVAHGQTLQVTAIAGRTPARGEVVLALADGIPDLLRVAGTSGGTIDLTADAESGPPRRIAAGDVLGRATAVPRGVRSARWLRLGLELREACLGRPDDRVDPADGLREKYDAQAVHYARSDAEPLRPDLVRRLRETVPEAGRILVAGSGTGREAFALEALGFEVIGIDFAPSMVEEARKRGSTMGSRVSFILGDLRDLRLPDGSLAAVLFTPDVYSFVPRARQRREMLGRLRRALAPGGILVLSARCRSGASDRCILTLQWLAGMLRGARVEWGDSHTRWLDAAGRLHRAYVHVFTPRALEAEVHAAGFDSGGFAGGHRVYRPGRLA